MRNTQTRNYFKLKQAVSDGFGKVGRALFTHKYSPTQFSGKAGGVYAIYNSGYALTNWVSNVATGEDASVATNRVGGASTMYFAHKLYKMTQSEAGKAALKAFAKRMAAKKGGQMLVSALASGPFAAAIALASAGILIYDIYNFVENYDSELGAHENLKEQGYVASPEVGF